MTIRIKFDHQIFSLQKYGGISRYFSDLYCQLGKHNNLLSPQIDISFSDNCYLKNTNISCLPSFSHTKVNYAMNEICALTANLFTTQRPNIIHRTYFYKRFELGSHKNVMTFYDCIPEKFPEFFDSSKIFNQKNSTIRSCDAVIAISQETKEDLMTFYGVPEDKIKLIHLYPPELNYFGHRLIKDDYILFVGNRNSYKNFERLVTAFAQSPFLLNNFKLICFGGPPFQKHEHLLFNNLGLQKNLVQHVDGEEEKLGDYYQFASCFVFPSLAEGFGIPLLEAWSSGTKICCSNLKCFKEVIGENATYFDPYDVESITCAIELSIEEEKFPLNTHPSQFNLDRTVTEHIQLYRDLVQ